jgi:hypothetical protein
VRIFDSVCFHRIKLIAIRRASKPAHEDDDLGGFLISDFRLWI